MISDDTRCYKCGRITISVEDGRIWCIECGYIRPDEGNIGYV